jgi:hypothetical protein
MPVDFAELFAWCDLHVSRWRTLPVTAGFISRPLYYTRQGFAIGADGSVPAPIVWALLMERDGYERVARDELPDGSELSTVWLGLDSSYGFGPPLIFETMRFSHAEGAFVSFPNPTSEPEEQTIQLRYTTEEQALAVHHEIRRRLVLRLGS